VAVDAARGDAGALAARTPPVAAEQAASDLYARFRDRIYGFCLYRLDEVDEAEDAVQTTFLYAFRALRRGVVPVAEGPWLFAIAKNVCLERHRTRRRRLEVPADPLALASEAAAVEHSDDDGLRLQEALGRLSESQRLAYVLREWRGLSYREIAATMETSVSAVETLIFRARRALAEILAEGEERRERKGVARALDLGSLAAALKSALGGGAAAKLVAAAAVVSSVAVVAGSAPPRMEPAEPRAAAHAFRTPSVAVELGQQPDLHRVVTAAPASAATESPRVRGPEPAPGEPKPARVDPKPAPSAVDEVAGTVGQAVSGVGATLPQDAPDLPLPAVETPELLNAPAVDVPDLEAPDLAVTVPLKGDSTP
jgi:RNA polymerase sigma-70 factor (ECF subfamily)